MKRKQQRIPMSRLQRDANGAYRLTPPDSSTNERPRTRSHHRDSAAVPAAHLEPGLSHEPLATQKASGLDGRCRIHLHSRRYRLADPRGLCDKYVIDAIVASGVLRDDSSKYISDITETQEVIKKSAQEETIITLTW
jgi:hypothetical protein